MTESTMMETDNSTNTTTTTTKEVNDDQMIEDQKSQTLIANVHLIKKSVEVKGEPRFIANVFRQVSLALVHLLISKHAGNRSHAL